MIRSPTFALNDDIDFNEYLRYLQTVNKFDINLDEQKLKREYRSIKDKPCDQREQDENHLYIEPICLFHNKLPEIQFTDTVDLIRDRISSFNDIYDNTATESFKYDGTTPIYHDKLALDFLTLQNSQAHKAIATFHSRENDRIKIPKYIVAQIIADSFTFYVSYNDTSMRRGCTLRNYTIGLHSLDKLFLYPGDVLNFNRHITWLDYCTWTGPQHLRFYSWVCWSASQLFRVSLLAPHITVTQRHGHSERWSLYYGNDITGDDATIYEMNKQLEIRNDDDRWLYFRVLQGEGYDYLVAVSPYKSKKWVQIQRERETRLRTNLTKTVYDIYTDKLIETPIQFPTRYIRQNYTRN